MRKPIPTIDVPHGHQTRGPWPVAREAETFPTPASPSLAPVGRTAASTRSVPPCRAPSVRAPGHRADASRRRKNRRPHFPSDSKRPLPKSGTDPGVSSVNDPSSPVDIFISHVRRLYDPATGYGGSRPKSQLVMEFLRHEDYDNHQWLQLIGDVDDGFIRYGKNSGIKMIREFRDPFHGIDIKVPHPEGTCNGTYVSPPLPHPTVNECNGDVAGWGGDLMTFYGEWRRDSGSYSSGYTYCMEKLAKLDAAGTLKLRDLVEDADGHNIAMMVRANKTIVEAVEAYYTSGGHLSRFRQFYSDRFQDAIKGKKIVERIPTNDIYPIISAGRL
ncbi:hypothetical protein GCM10017673_16880 [Streptosporangium violaceochromogenes]|nr:hypothetical protein GCM10017673_16880 [Streptosporangium violaceochromogenes]